MFLSAETCVVPSSLPSPQNGLRYSFSLPGCESALVVVAHSELTLSSQARPQVIRTQIRLSSTSSKTLSLKERLAELIPAELENVRPSQNSYNAPNSFLP